MYCLVFKEKKGLH